jgi:hypothetical protein
MTSEVSTAYAVLPAPPALPMCPSGKKTFFFVSIRWSLVLQSGPNVMKTFYGRNLQMFVISYIAFHWQAFPAEYYVCEEVWSLSK